MRSFANELATLFAMVNLTGCLVAIIWLARRQTLAGLRFMIVFNTVASILTLLFDLKDAYQLWPWLDLPYRKVMFRLCQALGILSFIQSLLPTSRPTAAPDPLPELPPRPTSPDALPVHVD